MSGRWWTTKEIRTLQAVHGKFSNVEIGRELSRSRSSIAQKARELKLTKTPEQVSAIFSKSNKRVQRGFIRRQQEERNAA